MTLRRIIRSLVAIAVLAIVAASCSSGSDEQVIAAGDATSSTVTAIDPSATAIEIVQPTPLVAAPTSTPAPRIFASCDAVPTFNAADTVSIACADGLAVSPELFAQNAGWHVFADQGGVWNEVDYGRTCCEVDDVAFVDLLRRNGASDATVAALCAASRVGPDSITGCTTTGGTDETPVFEPGWLRVNGLGDSDFGTPTDEVLATVDVAFGAPITVTDLSECPGGPATIADFANFSLLFQDGQFGGWFYESSNPALTTPSGVAPGISRPELERVYTGVAIDESTLGLEFFFEVPAGYVGGFIDPETQAVTSMYAGTTCFFR